jgi:H/ACA ribonucleoprotein complex subunit 2
MPKSEKREKKEKKPKVDDAEAEADDVEMADVSEVSASHVSKCSHAHIILVPKKSEEGERNHHSIGRFVSSCATIGAEKACEKAAQNDQERYAYLFLHSRSSAHHFSASKARQVKRGVKEVVKGIRKGEKGYVLLSTFVFNQSIDIFLACLCWRQISIP